MPRTAHRPYAAGLAVVAALALGACTSEGGAAPPSASTSGSGTASTSGTATGSPTSSVGVPSAGVSSTSGDPGIPVAARANTAAGAEAFTTYFMQQANKAYRDATPQTFDSLVTPACKTCAGLREAVVELQQKAQHYDGDFGTPVSIDIATFSSGTAKTFVTTKTAACRVRSASDQVISTVPPDDSSLSFFLAYEGSWQVTEIQLAA